MPLRLGEGIAQSQIEPSAPSYVRIGYAPTEEEESIMKVLGFAFDEYIESTAVGAAVDDGQVAFYRGTILMKEKGTSQTLLDQKEIHDLQSFIKEGGIRQR